MAKSLRNTTVIIEKLKEAHMNVEMVQSVTGINFSNKVYRKALADLASMELTFGTLDSHLVRQAKINEEKREKYNKLVAKSLAKNK